MKRDIRVRGVRRKQIDDDKLAMAFMMLAKTLHEQRIENEGSTEPRADEAGSEASQ